MSKVGSVTIYIQLIPYQMCYANVGRMSDKKLQKETVKWITANKEEVQKPNER